MEEMRPNLQEELWEMTAFKNRIAGAVTGAPNFTGCFTRMIGHGYTIIGWMVVGWSLVHRCLLVGTILTGRQLPWVTTMTTNPSL